MRPALHFVMYPLIAVFWLLMWGMLLRTELRPQGASLREVPLEHVEKLIFRHEEGSNLVIHSDGVRIGQMQVVPHAGPDDQKIVDCTGGIQIRMPDGNRERVSWKGSIEMNDAFAVQLLHIIVAISPTATASNIEVTINPVEKWASYVWKNGPEVLDQQTFPLTADGLGKLAEHLGIEPGMIQSTSLSKGTGLHLTAHQSSYLVHNEKVETYEVAAEQNEQTLLDIQISQLGVILQATTIFGWTLESE